MATHSEIEPRKPRETFSVLPISLFPCSESYFPYCAVFYRTVALVEREAEHPLRTDFDLVYIFLSSLPVLLPSFLIAFSAPLFLEFEWTYPTWTLFRQMKPTLLLRLLRCPVSGSEGSTILIEMSCFLIEAALPLKPFSIIINRTES